MTPDSCLMHIAERLPPKGNTLYRLAAITLVTSDALADRAVHAVDDDRRGSELTIESTSTWTSAMTKINDLAVKQQIKLQWNVQPSDGNSKAPLTSDDILITSGCSGAIDIALRGLLNPGNNILLPKPGFPFYQALCSQNVPVTSSVDAIMKMPQLIEHVENRIKTLRSRGDLTTTLSVSLELYREKLCEMEISFSKEH